MFTDIIQYFATDSDQYLQAVGQHLTLSLTTLLLASLCALPLGYLGSEIPVIAKVATSFAQALRIIPSLALLFILIPIMGVGTLPAITALFVLALPPLLINTLLGFREVSPQILEVGTGLGMDAHQLFWQVKFPLALPYILNGIKLALVEIMASATLATYIGAGGLGTLIFTGLGLYRLDLLLIGGVSVALLSLLAMVAFDYVIGRLKNGS
ncbi:glycine betaine choline ABC transporter permease component [Ligilactobacillus equi DSM 15833 = JCM 10991]|uniref:Glycine betaine choline ABC transporter permease component n=1 Tax=Ligilactobacillus equi DSM 15833 = JCM 10991 TaxID=1423740 RepID=A0A0R1TLK3_9LACO|nr:ABC transporter permease [Ligilactobacillus equi]KRL79491.1 glycine betaine choline ABC transporter permease component [Ligilactobacillus equi DSM 15833 = JCM 10991]